MVRAASSRVGQKRGSYVPRDPSWVTPEFRAKVSARMKATQVSPETRAKLSAAKLGKSFPNHWTKDPTRNAKIIRGAHPRARPIEVSGRQFACKQDAVEQLPVSISTLDYWLMRGTNGARFI